MSEFQGHVKRYKNEGAYNDWVHAEFARLTNEIAFLKEHRDYIETEQLGFGERSFHYMWYLLLSDLVEEGDKPSLLEIGVYKGQVISLWSLIARELGANVAISCITPLDGNLSSNHLLNNRILNQLRRMFSSRFRKESEAGNLYVREDFEGAIRSLFERFDLDIEEITIFRGLSSDPTIIKQLSGSTFGLVYIDGDHSFEAVTNDIQTYAPMVRPRGYLVMDDASYFLPGSTFWKGHKEVSRACEVIEEYGFTNVLNVGHNRVYQRDPDL